MRHLARILISKYDFEGQNAIFGVFPQSMVHHMFPCVAWSILMDRADQPVLLQYTRHPFAFSREVNPGGMVKVISRRAEPLFAMKF